jgi:transposase
LERNKQDRAEFRNIVNTHYLPEQLVFADESHINRLTMRRPYVWSKRGKCAYQYEFQFQGAKYSILPAITLNGIIHLKVVENAVTGADFCRFVEDLLLHMNEWLLPNSVLIIDNVSIHKVTGIWEMVEERSTHLLYLPLYSPDLNPIELVFSSIKAWLCANRDQVSDRMAADGSVYNMLWQAVHSVSAESAWGWYKHCGYLQND